MTPILSDPWLTIYGGDCRDVLATLDAESVHCVVTSPPYWGLRDYGVTGQLGMEPTPEAYVANLVTVFREVRRVLRSDGTLWLNLGDTMATGNTSKASNEHPSRRQKGTGLTDGIRNARPPIPGLAAKQLVGIPWRVAFALQADGWYLRSDIIWSKPNPMPESVTDRPTRSHEYLFLLSKRERYYYDADAVREPHVREWGAGNGGTFGPVTAAGGKQRVLGGTKDHRGDYPLPNPAGRNRRSVWTIATRPYPGAHFAVFPSALVEPCILAGTSERGVCPECGAPWERVVERRASEPQRDSYHGQGIVPRHRGGVERPGGFYPTSETTGWRPTCTHDAAAVPATVLDPFAGSGTVGMVAQRLSRRAVLIDLNPDYLKQQLARNRDIPLGLGAA